VTVDGLAEGDGALAGAGEVGGIRGDGERGDLREERVALDESWGDRGLAAVVGGLDVDAAGGIRADAVGDNGDGGAGNDLHGVGAGDGAGDGVDDAVAAGVVIDLADRTLEGGAGDELSEESRAYGTGGDGHADAGGRGAVSWILHTVGMGSEGEWLIGGAAGRLEGLRLGDGGVGGVGPCHELVLFEGGAGAGGETDVGAVVRRAAVDEVERGGDVVGAGDHWHGSVAAGVWVPGNVRAGRGRPGAGWAGLSVRPAVGDDDLVDIAVGEGDGANWFSELLAVVLWGWVTRVGTGALAEPVRVT
jgi:hypothetical protein